jgi:hypothetical protein
VIDVIAIEDPIEDVELFASLAIRDDDRHGASKRFVRCVAI